MNWVISYGENVRMVSGYYKKSFVCGEKREVNKRLVLRMLCICKVLILFW